MRIARIVVLAMACDGGAIERDGGGEDARVRDAGHDDAGREDAGRGVDSGLPLPTCPAIAVEHGASIDGYVSDVYTWRDADCRPRLAAMVRNDAADPAGHRGGYLRRVTYELADGSVRTVDGSSDRHPGFGYTVTHYADTASSSRDTLGTYTTVLEGRHHAIHEYRWTNVPIDGQNVAVIIRWMFATGRDHPLWAITYDLSGVAADAVEADTRSPYGDLQWDGGMNADVDGVGWGDRYRFRTTHSPVTLQGGWDYSQPNTIPHVIEWSVAADAEMGLVQTQTYTQHDGGGYWFYSSWGMTDADGPMPEDWNWTYQLNQYEIPFLLTSKRMAWGSNYGAVGQRQYPAYGDDRMLVGWPHQSYAVFVVLDRHSIAPVDAQVAWMERVQGVTLSATSGEVVTSGPAGVGRTDTTTYDPPGWDPIHAVWTLRGATTVSIAGGPLVRPTFHVLDWPGGDPVVSIDGATLQADADYFATLDAATSSLWVTLARDPSGRVLSVAP
jgi:hypothetical protein